MRRSVPLTRRTPLQRNTPLRRTAIKTKPPRRGRSDPVWRDHVLARDGECIIRKLTRWGWIDGTPCVNPDGTPMTAQGPWNLTEEHPKRRAGMSAYGADRDAVAACWGHNAFTVETSKYRTEILRYVDRLIDQGKL